MRLGALVCVDRPLLEAFISGALKSTPEMHCIHKLRGFKIKPRITLDVVKRRAGAVSSLTLALKSCKSTVSKTVFTTLRQRTDKIAFWIMKVSVDFCTEMKEITVKDA